MLEAAAKWRDANRPYSILIIAIGSSNRPQNLANPWTAAERQAMLEFWANSRGLTNFQVCAIPDIEDPPNWVAHASKYHGQDGVLITTDLGTTELYTAAGWEVVALPLHERATFEGWRVRETARMLSTIGDEAAIREVLGGLIPDSVLNWLIENDALRRLAFMGEGGEPVG